MKAETRESGLEPVGKVAWGTHLCLFYETAQDLTDLSIPYFEQGLKQNELCVWATADPLPVSAAHQALRRVLPDLDDRIRSGQMRILDSAECYLGSGRFDPDRMVRTWLETESEALRNGYEGVRCTGNASWLERRDWKRFSNYEGTIDNLLGGHRILALCAYPIAKCGTYEMLDVTSKHQVTLLKRGGVWERIESLPHRHTMAALATREEEFRAIFELSAVGQGQADALTGRFVRVNRKLCELTGYSDEELRQLTFMDITHPEDRERDRELIGAVVEGRADSWSVEKRYLRKDGTIRWVHVNGTVLRDSAGRPLRTLAVIQDISDRKQAEAARRENEQRLRLALESGRTGTWVWEIEGKRVTLDALAREHYQLPPSPEPISTEQLFELILPDDRPRLRRSMAALLHGTQDWNEEYRVLRPDGQVQWLAGRGAVTCDPTGRPVRVIGVSYDITERKRAEEQLRHLNRRLELLLAERTALADERAAQLRLLAVELTQVEQRERNRSAQVLHDHLQPLLVAARLRLGLLDDQTPKSTWPRILSETEELLVQAIDSTRSLSVELNPPVLQEEGLAPALEWLARWMETKHQLQIELRIDPDAEPGEETTSLLCFQAARELLLNVVKHAGVNRARVRLRRGEADQICLEVSDQGVGFDLASFRARPPAQRGFGLWSIEQRLRMIGGRLQIESRVGKGTSTTIVILNEAPPASTQKSAALTPPADRPAGLAASGVRRANARIRLLLADDHRILRECLAEVLRLQQDFEVVGEAEDGPTAITQARQLRPDVLIMDVSMPQLDGIEATRQITRELPDVRVIGLSTHEQSAQARAMREAGAVAYVTKSGPAEVLIQAIRRSVASLPSKAGRSAPRKDHHPHG